MKLYCMQLFVALFLMLFVQSASSNQKDDLILVEKLIELYPDVDLTKEAILQTEIIGRKYNKDLASILSGQIRYKVNQKSQARKSFTQVQKDSRYFKESILTYYQSAVSEPIKDSSGVRESTGLFIDNKLWIEVKERDSDEWELVKQIFKSYSDLNRTDKTKIAHLKKILNELDIVLDIDGEVEILISESEKVFLNRWQLEEGKLQSKKKLESLLAILRDLEFGEQTYEYFTAFPNRARVLTLIGQTDKALGLLEKTKEKIVEYDAVLKKHLESKKDLTKNQKKQALSQMSVLPQWYYAKALALFQNFRKGFKSSKEDSGEFLFGKHGAAVNFYLCVKKFPENNYSYKSILAYQGIRNLINKEYSKNMKELSVTDLIQAKAFYIVDDSENALKYLSKAVLSNDTATAYEAYNLAVGASVKLAKFDDADKYFKEMSEKFSKLNKAPEDYITKLTNYCVATYLKQAGEAKELSEKEAFYKRALNIYGYAKDNAKRKSNVSVKYLFASRVLNSLLKKDKKSIDAGLISLEAVISSLLSDHKLSEESAKISKTLGIVYQKAGRTAEAVKQVELYLSGMKTFTAKPNTNQIKMKMLLVELLIGEGDYNKAESYLTELSDYREKYSEEISSIKVRLLYSKLLKNSNDRLRAEYMGSAETHIENYKKSKSRPFIIAQLATIYQNENENTKSNRLYALLQKEYPEHAVNQGTGYNQVLALLKAGNGVKALEVLSSYEGLSKMTANNIYAVSLKISKAFEHLEMSQDSASLFLSVLTFLDSQKEVSSHVAQKTALMKSKALVKLGKISSAEDLLSKTVERFPQGSYMIDLKILLAECFSKQRKFNDLSSLYSSLQSMVSHLKGGRGDSSLSIRISAECSELFSEAKDEKYIKKGKYIAYLASQYNVSSLGDADIPNLEKVEYWNAWYSKKLNNPDFLEIKKSFLRRYPSSKYAPELRKL